MIYSKASICLSLDHPFGLDKRVSVAEPVAATQSAIRRFHTSEYIQRVIKQSESGLGFLDLGDTPAFKGVFEAAATVADTGLAALESVINGDAPRCFIPIAGLHHAKRNMAAGFCVCSMMPVS